MLHARSPHTTFRVARVTAWALMPLAVAYLLGLGTGVIPDTRLALAVFVALTSGCVGAAVVSALAACQVAIHHAFRAGLETGQASVWPGDPDTRPRPTKDGDPLLRLVE